MHDHRKHGSTSQGPSSKAATSHSVGSLPAPAGLQASELEHSEYVGLELAPRLLAGRWRQALRAERNLGLVLWAALAVVLFLVSR